MSHKTSPLSHHRLFLPVEQLHRASSEVFASRCVEWRNAVVH
uniref:Uncharacterized protein n=1 Tax=Parascaris equorum TaxID=6256 RepID=A0A914R157_PAREQ